MNYGISIQVQQEKNTINDVKLINGSPYIKSKVFLEASIISSENDIDYSNVANLKEVENYATKYLEAKISDYLYKTSKDLGSDINGFGQYLMSSYLTIDDWENTHWLDNYKNAFFDVEVNTNVDVNSLFVKH